MTNKQADVGVCVGRFQTPDLHDGHKAILDAVNSHNQGIVFIGVAATPVTKTNPLDFITRKMMVQEYVGNHVTILPIADHQSDHAWSENLDNMIKAMVLPFRKIALYHSRDSFVNHYFGHFRYACVEIPTVGSSLNATNLRNLAGNKPINDESFRCGVIYASQNMFPRVQPVVDVTVVDTVNKKVLLGRKHGVKHLCFIGGFVDMNDETLEQAAVRELDEETGIRVPENELQFVCTNKIYDWRDTPSTSMMTTFFMAPRSDYTSIACQAADDIEELVWRDLCLGLEADIGDNHKPLLRKLIAFERNAYLGKDEKIL